MFGKEPAGLIYLNGSVQDPSTLCCLGTCSFLLSLEGKIRRGWLPWGRSHSYAGSQVLGMGNVWLTIEWVWWQ